MKTIISDKLIKYFTLSCLSAVVDYLITIAIFYTLNWHYIVTNTIGIIAGFLLHFILGSKFVFKVKMDISTFAVYIVTFIMGLYMANVVIWLSYKILHMDFNISKFLSMVVPFFAMYYIRLFIYRVMRVNAN